MDLKLSKKIEEKGRINVKKMEINTRKGRGVGLKSLVADENGTSMVSSWNFLIVFGLFLLIFATLVYQLTSLQVVQGEEMAVKSENNQVRVKSITALRGVVFDSNGLKLVENSSSTSLYITIEDYVDDEGTINADLLERTSNTLGGILGDHWKRDSSDGSKTYSSIQEKVYSVHEDNPYFTEILLANDLSNEEVIKIKANINDLPGITLEDGSKRYYPYTNLISNILGYTGEVTAEDLKSLDYVTASDIVGRTGIERIYDKELAGKDGQTAWEVDSFGRTVSDEGLVLSEPVAGQNLYLTIDMDVQKKLYEIIEASVDKNDAVGGAGVIENVDTGEILALVTYPGYDNNLFVNGISSEDYASLVNDSTNPLLDRAVAAQVPAGSTFKTMVAVSALDAGAITKFTKYVSRANYTFSNGAAFQEYHNHAYGVLNVIDAIRVSSNIFFCELIRNWDMNKLVPYLEKFGIGEYTGIDVSGEAPGRIPSPENKEALANSTSPWLDPVWYPEGDSCNSVIGQGITLVTPIQMANWMGAIANEGTLYQPHVAKYFESEDGTKTYVENKILQSNIASTDAFNIVKEGMWEAVNAEGGSIGSLSGLGVVVAAKTGTAEFGALNNKGEYEHTHSWVGGFFPYDNPQYSFSIFLEDGGESINAVYVMKELLVWMVANGKI